MENNRREALRIYYIGHEKCQPAHSFGPATRKHYLMHFILDGRGTYFVRGQKLCVKKGQAFLICPDEVTTYTADSRNPWEYIWVAFYGEEARRLLSEYGLMDGNLVCDWDSYSQVCEYLFRMVELSEINRCSKEELLGWFYLVFSHIKGKEKEGQLQLSDYFEKARQYIQNNYGYGIRIEDVARYIGIDRTYLYRIFMEYTGASPKKYLIQCQIQAARDLIENSRLSLTEISYSCGWQSPSVFAKQFREQMGVSPREYKKTKGR